MKRPGIAIAMIAGTLLMVPKAFPEHKGFDGRGIALVTVLPARGGDEPAHVSAQDFHLKVDGKPASVTGWTPLQGGYGHVELVLMIDSSARMSLGLQLNDIARFITETPSNTKIAVAYMEGGQAVFASPLSADPAPVLHALHLPAAMAGANGSPYFCLSDLARRWPSADRTARRIVVMITDGVDYFEMRYDPEDPYVQAAIKDSVSAGLIVYAMYWRNQGIADNFQYETNAGQNLMLEVTDATGGKSYWEGMGNPVSFQPYFVDLRSRLRNQYALSFSVKASGNPGVMRLDMKAKVPSAKIFAPHDVLVVPVNGGAQ